MISRKIYLVLCIITLMAILTGCGNQSAGSAKDVSKVVEETNSDMNNYFIDDVVLNSGYKMPRLGLGTWTLSDETAEDCVYFAIKQGYRLIDTARYYGNERGVGNGVRKAINDGIVKREEIFVTSKIMPGNYNNPDQAIDDSLKTLGLDYIDLMLIHQPGRNDEGVYKALERGVKAGKIKSIGISNYYTPREFDRIRKIAEIVPAVVQNENHLFYQNMQLQKYVKQYGTVIESWYPFGGRGNTQEILNNSLITDLAAKYKKTPAQIILRWHVQACYITIPGSKNPKHIAENYDIFDFELSNDDMQQISNLNKNRRFENW